VEADFSGAQLMNEYIQNGQGDPYSSLKAMNVGFLMNQEFLDFIEWLKSYNKNKNSADQIKFFGCDMMLPQYALKSFADGSIPVENPLTEKSKETISVIQNWNFRQPNPTEETAFRNLLVELKSLKFKTTDDSKVALYQQYTSNIEQCLINLMEHSWFQRSINRDKFMAQNVEWIYRSDHRKSIVWAHNEHIAKNITENNNLPMGNYLSDTFKDQYYALGLAFGSGTVRAVLPNEQHSSVITLGEVTIKNSADQLFSKCRSENFFLNLSPDNSDILFNNFLTTKMYTRSIGSLFRPGKDYTGTSIYRPLKTIYDGIFFIRNTTAASPQLPEIKYN
jgi:erythromycin esterase